MLLVLFEPAGTLLLGDERGPLTALRDALEDVYAVKLPGEPLELFSGGATSWQASFSLLRQAGLSEELIRAGREDCLAYAASLYRAEDDPALERVHWQARELLVHLASRGYRLGFVSLLPKEIERARLAAAGLALAAGPSAGADDVRYHTELYPLARARATAGMPAKSGPWAAGEDDGWPRHLTVAVGARPALVCRAHSDPVRAVCLRDPLEPRQYSSADTVVDSLAELSDAVIRYEPKPYRPRPIASAHC